MLVWMCGVMICVMKFLMVLVIFVGVWLVMGVRLKFM